MPVAFPIAQNMESLVTLPLRGAIPLLIAGLVLLNLGADAEAAPTVVPSLGAARTYAVLGGSTVVNTGTSLITGDLGVSPGSTISGFPPGIITGTNPDAAAAQLAVTSAYNILEGQACDTVLTGQDLGGLILPPGVYCFSSSAQLTGTLTLDGQGSPAPAWVFQIGTTLTAASGSSVVFINGGQACGAFWKVGSSATLGTTSSSLGHVLALTNITLTTGATVSGSLVARNGFVTLDGNNVAAVGDCSPVTTVASSRNPSNLTESVTFTATVTPMVTGGSPTGLVDFRDGAVVICSAAPLVSGQATCATSALVAGMHAISANYLGDGSNTPSLGALPGGQLVLDATPLVAGDVRISQFRFRGAALAGSGSRNEFIELYINKPVDVTVGADGWAVSTFDPAGSTKSTIATVPAGTILKAKSYYLIVNNSATNGFTFGALPNYPAFTTSALTTTVGSGDLQYAGDIPDGAGLAIFKSTTSLDSGNRLDSVGFSSVSFDPLYQEGTGLTPSGGISEDGEYAFVRKNVGGVPVDTGDNEADFYFVSMDARTFLGRTSQLGAPGPRGQSSGSSMVLGFSVIDPAISSALPPNRVTDLSFTPNHLEFRFRVINNTGQAITALRWRFVTLTNLNSPGYLLPTQADLRPITGVSRTLSPATSIGSTGVEGLTLELDALQTLGGGLNSTVVYALPGPLAPGASVDVNFAFTKTRGGTFRFLTQVEAVP